MGYTLVWLNKDGTKLYSTNTNNISSFSKDVDSCAEIVQQKNAEKAARSLVKYGIYDQMPDGGKLYVAKVERVALPITEIKAVAKKSGYMISSEFDGKVYYYRGAKKPAYITSYAFRDNGAQPTVFKTPSEAEKLIDVIREEFKNDFENEEKNRKTRLNSYGENAYKKSYDIALNAKVIKTDD